METPSLVGRLCIPVGACYKCAVSPLCVRVLGKLFSFFPPLRTFMHICVCVEEIFLGEKVCFWKLCPGISDASSTFFCTEPVMTTHRSNEIGSVN